MADSRLTHGLGQHPGARFRCVVCRKFVTATERGVCPTCGFVPPTITRVGRRDARLWLRAGHQVRARGKRAQRAVSLSWRWFGLVLVAWVLAGLAAVYW